MGGIFLVLLLPLLCCQKVTRTHYAWEYQQPNRKDMIYLEAEKTTGTLKTTVINDKMTLIEQVNGESFLLQDNTYLKVKNDLEQGQDYLSPKFYPSGLWLRVYTSSIPDALRRVQGGQAVLYEHFLLLFGGCA